MAYVYSGFIIQNRIDVGNTGRVVTTAKGDLVTDNGTKTVVLTVGTNGRFLKADSTTATGLVYADVTVTDIGLIAGNGLVLTGSTLDVGGSTTIFSATDSIYVNSSAIANRPLLSSGTIGTEAVYAALPLNNTNSVTGTLLLGNGGTNSTTFTADTIIAANPGATALISTGILTGDVGTLNGTQIFTNKSLVNPRIYTQIRDANGNISIEVPGASSAVNYVKIQNSITTAAPAISAEGTDTNIDLNLAAKGTGKVSLSGIKYPNADGTSGQVLITNGAGLLSFADVELAFTGSASVNQGITSTLFTFATASNTAYYVIAKFIGRAGTPVTYTSGWTVRASFFNNATTLTRVGGVNGVDFSYTPSSTSAVADVIVSATSINFNITADGTAGTQQWKVFASIISV